MQVDLLLFAFANKIVTGHASNDVTDYHLLNISTDKSIAGVSIKMSKRYTSKIRLLTKLKPCIQKGRYSEGSSHALCIRRKAHTHMQRYLEVEVSEVECYSIDLQ